MVVARQCGPRLSLAGTLAWVQICSMQKNEPRPFVHGRGTPRGYPGWPGSSSKKLKRRTRYAPGPPFFSCDTSPVNTTQVLIHIDQKLRLVLGVSSVYLCQFVADVAFRHCSIRYRTFLESRCSLYIEYGQTLRGSACPHLRAPLIHLKYHPK
jgi:hypothetical protein